MSLSRQKLLHIIDIKNGLGRTELLEAAYACLPSDYFFFEYNEHIIIYADDLFIYRRGNLAKAIELTPKGKVTAHLVIGNRLIMCCEKQRDALLCCCNLDTLSIEWKKNITNSKFYRAGGLSIYEKLISCYGNDQLLFIECETGKTVHSLKLSRIDKLFWPIKIDDENMLIGYTNWTNAGILKYNFLEKRLSGDINENLKAPSLDVRFISKMILLSG